MRALAVLCVLVSTACAGASTEPRPAPCPRPTPVRSASAAPAPALSSDARVDQGPVEAGKATLPDGVQVGIDGNGAVSIRSRDGQLLGAVGLPGAVLSVLWLRQRLVAVSETHVARLTLAGQIEWQVRVGFSPLSESESPVVAADGTVLVSTEEAYVAVDWEGKQVGIAPRAPSSEAPIALERAGGGYQVVSKTELGRTEVVPLRTPPTEVASDLDFSVRRVFEPPLQPVAAGPGGHVYAVDASDAVYDCDEHTCRSLGSPVKARDPTGTVLWGAVLPGDRGEPWWLGTRTTGYDMTSAGLQMEPLCFVHDRRWRKARELEKLFTNAEELGATGTAQGPPAACIGLRCAARRAGVWKPLTVEPSADGKLPDGPFYQVRTIGQQVWALTAEGAVWREPTAGSAVLTHDQSLGLPRRSVATFDGASADDVWFSGRGWLYHLRAGGLAPPVPSPVGAVADVFASGADSVWFAGASGVALFNGKTLRSIAGLWGPYQAIIGERDRAWVGGSSGLWLVERTAKRLWKRSPPPPTVPTPLAPAPRELAPEPLPAEVTRVEPPEAGGLRSALGLVTRRATTALSRQELWLHDGRRLVAISADGARSVAEAPEITQTAATSHGSNAWLSRHALYLMSSEPGSAAVPALPWASVLGTSGQDIQLVAETGSGQDLVLWHGATRHVSALPPAYYLASSSAFKETWLSGSLVMFDLGCTADGCLSRQVPGGQGVVVRRTASATRIYQVPAGPQSAVLVVGPEEAFSVGVGGSIVHWRGDTREDFVLAERPWLRAVASRGAHEVWIVGDDSTVLRWDGRAFRRVPLPGLAGDLALSGVGYLSDGTWIVTGPAGVFRIRLGRRSKTP
jgi:hypothetical protein